MLRGSLLVLMAMLLGTTAAVAQGGSDPPSWFQICSPKTINEVVQEVSKMRNGPEKAQYSQDAKECLMQLHSLAEKNR